MHTTESTGTTVPTFISKLWRLVEDTDYDHLIQWSQKGHSFKIHDQSKFAKDLLPLYFKHSNMASFIRQLNMYGFRKVTNIENSGLRSEGDEIEFYHQFFVKGKESELEFIKRKSSQQIPTGKASAGIVHLKHEDMTDILQDVESLKGKQESVDNVLSTMQRENEALWREVAILRQKHHKQQQIVEKLISFLVSLVQNRGIHGMKRKRQLMIDDTEENRELLRNKVKKINDFNETFNSKTQRSNGPIIHDITDGDHEDISAGSPAADPKICELSPNSQLLAPEMFTNSSTDQLMSDSKPVQSFSVLDPLQQTIDDLGIASDPSPQLIDTPTTSTATNVNSLLLSSLNTSPGSPALISDKQNTNETQNNIKDLVLSTAADHSVTPMTTSYLSDHLDGIDAELEWLQDQLSSGINIDPSALLGVRSDSGLSGLSDNYWLKQLFSTEDNPQNPSNVGMTSGLSPKIIGNEVIQFNPNSSALFDDLDFETIAENDINNESEESLIDEPLLPLLEVANEGTVSFPPETSTEILKH